MAQLEVNFPEDFLSELLETDFDEIAEEILTETAPVLEESMKKEVRGTIQHEGDSELVDSLTASKPKKTKNGDAWIVNVSPKGYSSTKKYTAVSKNGRKTHRKYPVSNALKAIWKEYGIPGRQPPRPFLQRSTNGARGAVIRKAQEIFNRKVGAE